MNEMIRTWFKAMLETERAAELAAVANEETWADGANGPETQAMHKANAANHQAYADLLLKLAEKADEPGWLEALK